MNKRYTSANELLVDSIKLAEQIYKSGFRADFIIGVWRGGAPVGIAIQEYMDYLNCPSDHIAIRTSSYYGIDKQDKKVNVHGLDYIINNINADNKVLLVDDIFDTGRSVEAIITEFSKQLGQNMPNDIRIACPWFKPNRNQIKRVPDYYVHTTDDWLVFPHELKDLTIDEITSNKPDIAAYLKNHIN